MFNFIKNQLTKIYTQVTTKLHALFKQTSIDETTLKELESLLISADTGANTTRFILQQLQQELRAGSIVHGEDLRKSLEQHLIKLLDKQKAVPPAQVYLLVGINGSGKTTFAGKLAYNFTHQGKTVLLAAADTFRAAAPEQLQQWAERSKSEIIIGKPAQDPASVVFMACETYKKEQYDVLIIDTAGRLQTKINLMKELEKIRTIISKQLPHASVCTLLTIDALLGQNSFEQARLFYESTRVDGIVLSKMDGTGKGGIVFAINQELHIPVAYISAGEQIEQLKEFNATEYVAQLLTQ